MEQSGTAPKRSLGRPVSFDRDTILEKAMLQFWRTGYETTSIADLTEAMGVTAPSLYLAFGDKEQLFIEAVRRYSGSGENTAGHIIKSAENSRLAAKALLEGSARFFTQPNAPAGCLLASAASTGSEKAERVRGVLREIRRDLETALQRRIEEDVTAGLLPATTIPKALSGLVIALIQGMSTLARDGASQKHLLHIAQTTLELWPKETRRRHRKKNEPREMTLKEKPGGGR